MQTAMFNPGECANGSWPETLFLHLKARRGDYSPQVAAVGLSPITRSTTASRSWENQHDLALKPKTDLPWKM
jgi:hypothetical protein